MSVVGLVLLRLWAMVQKEFIVTVMDKGSRKILILPIIIQSILFGYGATFNLENVPYVLFQDCFDKDATAIVQRLDNNPTLDLVRYCTYESCFKQSLDHGEALLGVHIGNNFVHDRTIFVATDARNTSSANMAVSYIQNIVQEYNREQQQHAVNNNYVSSHMKIEYRYLYNNNNITRYTILTGMILALSMLQVMMLASLSVSREREDGTFDMMLMSPLSPVEILIAKAFVPTVIATIQGIALFFICLAWFEIPFAGNFFTLVLLIVIFSLSTVGVGLAISAVSSTSQQSQVMSFTVVLPCIILSGLITPSSAMPAVAQMIAHADPLFYGYEAMKRIYLEGQGLMDVLHLLVPLIGLGLITLTISVMLFRGKLS